MPSPKRWFPVSRDLNDDPETWELTKEFGDRALRTWLEILAQLDAHDNAWKVTTAFIPRLALKVGQRLATVQLTVGWMLARGWLAANQPLDSKLLTTISSPNYWKYHRVREPKRSQVGSPPILSEPIRTEPPTEEKSKTKRGRRGLNGARPFPPDFAFTRDRMEYAQGYGIERPADEFHKFKAYHEAKGTRFKNWDAAYRNWILKAVDIQEERHAKT